MPLCELLEDALPKGCARCGAGQGRMVTTLNDIPAARAALETRYRLPKSCCCGQMVCVMATVKPAPLVQLQNDQGNKNGVSIMARGIPTKAERMGQKLEFGGRFYRDVTKYLIYERVLSY